MQFSTAPLASFAAAKRATRHAVRGTQQDSSGRKTKPREPYPSLPQEQELTNNRSRINFRIIHSETRPLVPATRCQNVRRSNVQTCNASRDLGTRDSASRQPRWSSDPGAKRTRRFFREKSDPSIGQTPQNGTLWNRHLENLAPVGSLFWEFTWKRSL